jgi:acetylglutamate synthase
VQSELDRKKREYETRMRACREKESALAARQERIRESVVKFEKFVSENDGKRARALKKERDEIHARRQKDAEIIVLRQQMMELTGQKVDYEGLLAKLSVYEAYLEGVLSEQEEWHEVNDLLMRHATLTASNADLKEVVTTQDDATEVMRSQLATYTKEAEDRILVQTSQIAHEQKRMERLKAASDKHDQMMQVRESKHIESHRVLGEAKCAITNIFNRCRKQQQPQSRRLNDIARLDVIMQRLKDLADVARQA